MGKSDRPDARPRPNLHNDHLGFDTRAIHFAYDPAAHAGAVAPPVFFTSTYTFPDVATNEAAAEIGGLLYAREHNPTTEILQARLASLEGAEDCAVFASGMAAFGTLMLASLSQGDEIIVHRTLYTNVTAMTEQALPRFGIGVVPVDLRNPANLDAAITPRSRMVYFESPVNPTVDILNIAAIAERAHRAGLKVVVDSTFASPALQRPLEHGADMVMHSVTKYINGHGDVLAGALLGRRDDMARLKDPGIRYITGALLSPMAAMLVLRGLKTLSLRMQKHSCNALAVARLLETHPAVAWVSYPFLESHPNHDLAKRQMSAGSGMLAFGLHTGFEGARRFMDRLEIFARAVSLGDTESLIMHPASLVKARQKRRPAAKLEAGIGDDLMRMSVGIEDTSDLLADIRQALEGF